MKRIQINNKFTQWAEYLARYFGHDLLIYDTQGRLMWGSPARVKLTREELQGLRPVYRDIGKVIAYLNPNNLTRSEQSILDTIIPFIESQLDDTGDA
jgi:hypothetical protein